MDLSALIFVALALAWAVYLVPKALKHHDDVQRSRSVERFSARMRVLARREPTGRRGARLVVTPFRQASAPRIETKASSPGYSAATAPSATAPATATASGRTGSRPGAAAVAARRRRRVLGTLLLALVVVGGLAVGGVLAWGWLAAPGALVVAWLIACRLMVRRERASVVRRPAQAAAPAPAKPAAPAASEADAPVAAADVALALEDTQAGIPVVAPVVTHGQDQGEDQAAPPVAPPGQWDMVPMTLPTYVDKPAAARRTVHTIDLDSTGVWSSGRSERDSELAREAEQADRAARERARARRASGA